jgi:HAD superfamily hydrolase (TIGR01509 family)
MHRAAKSSGRRSTTPKRDGRPVPGVEAVSAHRAGVLVDVDGTLLDTNYLHTLAWSRAFVELGVTVPMHTIHALVGMGGDQLVPELLDRPVDGADDAHARRYEELINDVRPFAGAGAFLWRLHAAGLAVVLATSATADDLPRLRELLDADAAITAVVTGDDVAVSKPAPDVFVAACRAGCVDPARALVVGDTVWDVRAATAAGLGCVALESGGTSRADLWRAGARAVYRDVAQLTDQLRTSPIGLLLGPGPVTDDGPG